MNLEKKINELLLLSEEARVNYLKSISKNQTSISVYIAKRVLEKSDSFISLMDDAVGEINDLSTVGIWVDNFIDRVGKNAMLNFLKNSFSKAPLAVASSLYFLKPYINTDSLIKSFNELYELCYGDERLRSLLPAKIS